MMIKSALSVMTLACLSLSVTSADPAPAAGDPSLEANCKGGCNFFCNTLAQNCLDLPPFVDCGANKQSCQALCGATCTCFASCTGECFQRAAKCQELEPLGSIACKTQVTLCASSCPAVCKGQFLTSAIPDFLRQILATFFTSVGQFLPGLPSLQAASE